MTSLSVETEVLNAPGLSARVKQAVGGLFVGESLKAKAFRGGAWLGSGSIAEQAARFVRNLILVRLLAPDAFGTMAIVMSTSLVLQAFTEVGVREALVQNPQGAESKFINATWWMAFVRSLLVCVSLFFLAPSVAGFYRNPELTPLLRVALSGLLLEGAMSARAYVAIKDMRFSRWAVLYHGGGILGVVITVVLSFFIRDVWALVIGTTCESAARCVLSYIICPWSPSLRVDRKSLRELFKYTRGVIGLPLLTLIFMRSDVFVLGKLLHPAQLGLYTMGIAIAQVPVIFVSNLLYQVSLATLSQIQEDKARTNRVIIRVTSLVAATGAPVLAFTYFCGGSVLTLMYGRAYAISAGPLFLASCAAFLSLANSQITGVFYAAGAPSLHRRCMAATAVLMILLIYPFSKWLGPVGAQLACLISVIAGFGLQLERMQHFTGLKLSEYATVIARSAAPSVSVIIVCLGSRLFPFPTGPLPSIGVGGVGCLLAYALGCVMLLRQQGLVQRASHG
ncbi:MAG: oligosaccharide flippase family protein [Candidatus Sulfotelmatobacter sp.]